MESSSKRSTRNNLASTTPDASFPSSSSLTLVTISSESNQCSCTMSGLLMSSSSGEPSLSTMESSLSSKILSRFWNSDQQSFNSQDQICGSTFSQPMVWDVAVTAKGVIQSDNTQVDSVLSNLYKYQNKALKVFSASTAGDTDIYNDDNAQVAWAFIEGYKVTGNSEYLQTAKDIVSFLMTQVDKNGGVIWHYKDDYIASISTIEAALAAIRLYGITKDKTLLTFTKTCLSFAYTYFQDPSDKLFYDGLSKSQYSDINKGKLTYTVGCALSVLSELYKYDSSNSDEWISKIKDLADATTYKLGAFYNGNGFWNNQMKYVHLLYVGFSDIFEMDYDFSSYKPEVSRQAAFIQGFLKDSDSMFFSSISRSTYTMVERYESSFNETVDQTEPVMCSGTAEKSLMDNASVLQIFYQMSRCL
ncbi:Six-hairpin glycosidase [Yamadazyma tenuis ATCC 10573]|uniref:Six-hairpin glycosidase n=1 Tax=Candida tenuis (strain ATCC 10573 / BCRC 21748 / CBS 615 / JCM 9827 / NBRC 10315 / NRRL Y-1498 / VKM Y-70) TaxID=590646 RepID=G3AYC7_CANTC|nr:Six-hairpin glycosidase [Yamadazyma tenuis ATCC 10573]EGV65821.1 Six-hairpin glycosidase [Yamadazyma tenuis ATCC 10573]